MNQIFGMTLKILRSGRFSALALLVGLGILFTAAGAKAGCGIPYNAGNAPAIPFVSTHSDDERNEPSTIVGLWHVIYTATYEKVFLLLRSLPQHPSSSWSPTKPGTGTERNLKTRFCRPQAEISALEFGKT